MAVSSKTLMKIDNMEEFVDLFFSLYFMSEKNKKGMIRLSKNFKEVLDIILEKYKDYFADDLFDENGKFKIDEFISKAKYTKAKAYFKDYYRYDFITDSIFTEVGIDGCNQIIKKTKVDMRDVTMAHILSDFCVSEAQYLYNFDATTYSNDKDIDKFATLFLSRYTISTTRESEIIKFSKNFKEIFADIINRPDYREFLSSNNLLNENGEFKLEEFLYAMNYCRLKKYWASSWNFDIENDIIFTSINNDVANIIYKSAPDDMSMHIYYIVKDYMTAERKIKENNKKYIFE